MISTIITWCNRKELQQGLPSLVKTTLALRGEVIIVNFGGSQEVLKELVQGYEKDIKIVAVSEHQYFNKSCAQNLGAYYSTNPVLFFCDCDIKLKTPLIAKLLQAIQNGENTFATIAYVEETQPLFAKGKHIIELGYDLYIKTYIGRELNICYRGQEANNRTRMAPGLLLVRRRDFLLIQGYNSSFEGWGWESQDIISRLTLGLGLDRINEGQVMHISHSETSRVANTKVFNRWENRDRMFREAIANYRVGNFLGTYEADVEKESSKLLDGYMSPLNMQT